MVNTRSTKNLTIGQKVRLSWNGYPGVPKEFDGDNATIVALHRTRVTVVSSAFGGELTVRTDQIRTQPSISPAYHKVKVNPT